MDKWNRNIKPPENICPKKYCWFWSREGKCSESFKSFNKNYSCSRIDDSSTIDWYEACEPELNRDELPWFYFIPTSHNLNEDLREQYKLESDKLWGKDHRGEVMDKSDVKIVSTAAYINAPKWLTLASNLDYIILSKNASKQEVDSFIFSIFIYNNIEFDENPRKSFKNLIDEINNDSIVLSGGLYFYNQQNKILPSCCCGLEDWKEAVQGIMNERSPWLGHNPNPMIEFIGQRVIVWSDEKTENITNEDLWHIEFEKNDLIKKLNNIENDIKQFLTISFYNRVKEIDNYYSDELLALMLVWLDIK